MSEVVVIMSRAILRKPASGCEAFHLRTHPQRLARRTYASEPDFNKSFKGQLYDSTHQRLQRERAEQARFAEAREAQKGRRGAPAWMTPFGIAQSRPSTALRA